MVFKTTKNIKKNGDWRTTEPWFTDLQLAGETHSTLAEWNDTTPVDWEIEAEDRKNSPNCLLIWSKHTWAYRPFCLPHKTRNTNMVLHFAFLFSRKRKISDLVEKSDFN